MAEDIRKSIGKRIKTKRKEKGLTQERLAESSGLSINFISSIERGVGRASLESLQSIAKSLKCDLKFFFDLDTVYRREEGRALSQLLTKRIKKLDCEGKRLLVNITDYLIKP